MSKFPTIVDVSVELPKCSIGYCYPKPEDEEGGFILVVSEHSEDGKSGGLKYKKTFDCWESMLLYGEEIRQAALDWKRRRENHGR